MTPPPQTSPPPSAARRYVDFLRRHLWLIVLVAATAIGIAAATSLARPKVYRASSKIVVFPGATLNPQFGNTAQAFTQTMSPLLKDDVIARKVIGNLGLNETPENVLRHFNVSSTPDSAVLQVSYDAKSPREAVRILTEIGKAFTHRVHDLLGKPSGKNAPLNTPLVTAVDWGRPHASSTPISPHPARTLAFAGVIGLALGIVLGLLRDTLDERIRKRDEMEELFGAPVIAAFPGKMLGEPVVDPERGVDPARLQAVDPLRLRLARAGPAEGVITVTSGGPRDGQSIVAASLSVALALAGEHVICVDVSPRQKRSLSYYLNVRVPEAAERPIAGPRDVDAALREVALERVRERAGIEVVPAYLEGGSHDTVHELSTAVADGGGRLQLLQLTEGVLSDTDGFPSWSIADLAAELKSHAQRVIVDAPALPSAATFALLSVSDGAIAVGREGRTTKEQATQVRNALETLQVGSHALVSIGQASEPVPPYGRAPSGADHRFSSKRVRKVR
jgi:capsular polysaccharide biosynthesis protein